MSVVYFLVLLGVLVVVHEFGHFLAAKLLDIKVLRFSFGFGRPLVRVRAGETEYQIGAVPLGGYVRILGEEGDRVSPADAGRSLAARPLWQRLAVVFAGPAANLALPIVVYFALFAGHADLPAAVVGDVIAGGPAARAGVEPGDRVVAVDGDPVRYWEELAARVDAATGRPIRLDIQRDGRRVERFVTPVERVVRERDGRVRRRGWIGVSHAPFLPRIGVIDATSAAARAGLRTGDVIAAIDGVRVDTWTALRRQLTGPARRRTIAYLRGARVPGIPQVELLEPGLADVVPDAKFDAQGRPSADYGIAPAEMFVAAVEPGSPAARAGLRPGDLVSAIDGRPIEYWLELDQALQSDPGRSWKLTWRRTGPDGRAITLNGTIAQRWEAVTDEFGNPARALRFGAVNAVARGEGRRVAIEGRIGYAIGKAIARAGDTVVDMARGLAAIVAGRAPRESVGGPLMMYRVASVSGAKGWDAFLLLLALISVNLGLLNLLPIPMLDGGNLVVFAIEAVRRQPLTAEGRNRVMLVGLGVVVAITLLALRNDVVRYLI